MSRARGTVTKIVGTSSYVDAADGTYHCDLRARLFRRGGVRLAVGDEVEFEVTKAPTEDGPPGRGVIDVLCPRRNCLRRSRDFKRDQILCANVDRVFVVIAVLDPPYKRGFIDRVLVGIVRDGLEPVVVFNKLDLAEGEYAEVVAADAAVYAALGYEVLLVSAETGAGVEALRAAFAGRISAVVGPSGVGKSTLLNQVCPGLTLRTGEVSQHREGRGKHTTTAAELIKLPFGGFVVDTPGLRAFGLWNASLADLQAGFPEIAAASVAAASDGRACKFRDCAHKSEPECVVIAAVASGEIDEERYLSYQRLCEELSGQSDERQARRR